MLLNVLLLITALFVVGLLARNLLIRQLCAICFGISASWLVLLTLYKLSRFDNPLLLALLMGQSITGIFYLLRRRLAESLRAFTLPFFLSLTVLAYWLVGGRVAVLPVFGFLLLVWIVAYVLFTTSSDKGNKVAQAVITCCGDK